MPEDFLPGYSKIEALFHVANLIFQFSRVFIGFLWKSGNNRNRKFATCWIHLILTEICRKSVSGTYFHKTDAAKLYFQY